MPGIAGLNLFSVCTALFTAHDWQTDLDSFGSEAKSEAAYMDHLYTMFIMPCVNQDLSCLISVEDRLIVMTLPVKSSPSPYQRLT